MRLIKIPEDKYYEYKLQAMFDCYKWDPQFCDTNTLAKYILVLTKEEEEEIINLTKSLDKEPSAINAKRVNIMLYLAPFGAKII